MIPHELQAFNNWVAWRYEHKDDRPTKIPYVAEAPLRRAKSTDPATWRSYSAALDFCAEHPELSLGFALGDSPFVCVDLDKCRDPNTGVIEPWAMHIIEMLDSYTEVSPSGTGVHIFVRASLPRKRNRRGNIEVYEAGRYMTITGDQVPGTAGSITTRDLGEFFDHVFGDEETEHAPPLKPAPLPLSYGDDDVIEKIRKSKQGAKFEALWGGDTTEYDDDHSRADLALVGMLYSWTGGDEHRADKLFRQSGLIRSKWDEARGDYTYGELTLRKAAKDAKWLYKPDEGRIVELPGKATDQYGPEDAAGIEFNVFKLGDVDPEEVHWLWEPYMPLRKITFLAGDPGSKKTFLAINMCAAITAGRHIRTGDHTEVPRPVIYFTLEDGIADTIRPRAEAANADLNHFYAVDSLRIITEDGEVKRGTASLQFVEPLDKLLARIKPALIVFDPIQSFIGAGVDLHRANEVRPVLEGVGEIARKHGCAVLFVAHLNKGSGMNALYRLLGSIDLVGVSRSVLLISSHEGRTVMIHEKANLAAKGVGLEYDIVDGRVEWGRDVQVTSMDDMGDGADAHTLIEEAREYILGALSDGPVAASVLEGEAKDASVSKRTLERARAALRRDGLIDYRRAGHQGKIHWYRMDLEAPRWELMDERIKDA